MAAAILVARQGFSCDIDGQEHHVPQGAQYASTHPVAKAHAALFEPADANVEQPATARRAPKRT